MRGDLKSFTTFVSVCVRFPLKKTRCSNIDASSSRLFVSALQLDHEDPKDISYIFSASGYAPLSVRIIANVLTNGDFSRDDKLFPQPKSFHVRLRPSNLSVKQGLSPSPKEAVGQKDSKDSPKPHDKPKTSRSRFGLLSKIRTASSRKLSSSSSQKNNAETDCKEPIANSKDRTPKRREAKHTTLFYFVGGVTYAEIAGVRFLRSRFPNENLLVAGSSLINGNSLLRSVGEKVRGGTAPGFPI